MAHYAFINEENIVVEVIVGKDENDTEKLPLVDESWEQHYQRFRDGLTCLRTSYNTKSNQHNNDGVAFRGNFAIVGGNYDPDNDVFYDQQPYPSWVLNEDTWEWESPVPYPTLEENEDGNPSYLWNEEDQEWQIEVLEE